MPAEPALAAFLGCTVLPRLVILVRLIGLLPARRGAQPDRLICSGVIRLVLLANRRGFGLRLLRERLVACLSTIAL
jgi:hypothetical protein